MQMFSEQIGSLLYHTENIGVSNHAHKSRRGHGVRGAGGIRLPRAHGDGRELT